MKCVNNGKTVYKKLKTLCRRSAMTFKNSVMVVMMVMVVVVVVTVVLVVMVVMVVIVVVLVMVMEFIIMVNIVVIVVVIISVVIVMMVRMVVMLLPLSPPSLPGGVQHLFLDGGCIRAPAQEENLRLVLNRKHYKKLSNRLCVDNIALYPLLFGPLPPTISSTNFTCASAPSGLYW